MSTDVTSAPSITGYESLNDRVFVMVSSTASVVDATSPSRFHYFEQDGVIWGSYDGDTVVIGRFSGYRESDTVTINFVHLGINGATTSGAATSVISTAADGTLLLTENFDGPNGTPEVSVCREVRA